MDNLKDVVEEIKSRVDIEDVISDYIQLKTLGANSKGLCPFHHEKTPSFHVNKTKQIFKCFGCGEGGDVISFIMKIENLDFVDAVKFLANRCGIQINENVDEKTKQRYMKMQKFKEINVEAARFFYFTLMNTENPGYSYLKGRGLDEKTIKNFGLGFTFDSWDNLKNFLMSKGYTEKELFECGVLSVNTKGTSYYDKFRNRVMFPIFDYKGDVIGFGGRVMDDSKPKYLNSPDSELFNKRFNLYGLNIARKNITADRSVILVEGYMDLISLNQFGIKNVVATLGTSLTEDQASLIKKYADEVVISYDSDSAGVKAALRAIKVLENHDLSVKVLNLGEKKDPDEFIRSEGVGAMLDRIENASEAVRFRIDIEKKKYQIGDSRENLRFLKSAIRILSTIKSPIEQDYYINYLSGITNTDVSVIKSELNGIKPEKKDFGWKNRNDRYAIGENFEKAKEITDGNIFIEMNIIKAMMLSENARKIIPLKIDINDLKNENSRKIFSRIVDGSYGGIINTNDIYDESLNMEYLKELEKIKLASVDFSNTSEIEKIIRRFNRHVIDVSIKKIEDDMDKLEQKKKSMDPNSQEAKEVESEIMKLAMKTVELNRKNESL